MRYLGGIKALLIDFMAFCLLSCFIFGAIALVFHDIGEGRVKAGPLMGTIHESSLLKARMKYHGTLTAWYDEADGAWKFTRAGRTCNLAGVDHDVR